MYAGAGRLVHPLLDLVQRPHLQKQQNAQGNTKENQANPGTIDSTDDDGDQQQQPEPQQQGHPEFTCSARACDHADGSTLSL